MKIGDVLALAKMGYTVDDVKAFMADNSEETETAYKAEIEKAKNEVETKNNEIKNVSEELEKARNEIEELKKQITEIQSNNVNDDTLNKSNVDNLEVIKNFFKGGDL